MTKCPGCGYDYPDGCDVTCEYKHPMTEWISVNDKSPPEGASLSTWADPYIRTKEVTCGK
jgi:hypothetical protein